MYSRNRGYSLTLRTSRPGAIDLRSRRLWFDDNGDEGEGSDDAGTETQPDKSGSASDDTTFTQADVNRIASERAKRAEESALKKLYADLGFESGDDLKSLVTAHRAAEEAEKSELEKAQAEIEKARKKAEEAEQRATDLEQARLEDRRDNALLAGLNTAEKPAAVLTLIKATYAEDLKTVLGEEGTADAKAVEGLVKKAEAEWPGMFKSGSPGSQSHSGGKPPKPDKTKLIEEIKRGIRY